MEKETVRLQRKDGQIATITLAEHAGFCFGVGRALKKAEEAAIAYGGSGRKINTCGSLIHNRLVTDELLEQGVGVISSPEEAEEGSGQETAEEKPDKKSGRKQVPYREAENPDVGDPLPRWLIRLLMRKEELWNCMIR